MSEPASKCPSDCSSCPLAPNDGEGLSQWLSAHSQAAGDSLAGWALLWRSAAAFVLPLAMAIVGAVLAGEGETRRFAGLGIGLVAGLAAAAVVVRLFRPRNAKLSKGLEESQ